MERKSALGLFLLSKCHQFLNNCFYHLPTSSLVSRKCGISVMFFLYHKQQVLSAVWRPKKSPRLHQVLLYFFWSFRINASNTFSIENWIPLKSMLVGVSDVALFINISYDSINASSCTCINFGLVTFEWSTFTRNFIV